MRQALVASGRFDPEVLLREPTVEAVEEAEVADNVDDSNTLLDYSDVQWEVPSPEDFASSLDALMAFSSETVSADDGDDEGFEDTGFVLPIDREWL